MGRHVWTVVFLPPDDWAVPLDDRAISPERRAVPLARRETPRKGCDVPRKVRDFPARKGVVFCGDAAARPDEPVSTLTLLERQPIRDGVVFSESAAARQRAGWIVAIIHAPALVVSSESARISRWHLDPLVAGSAHEHHTRSR